MNGSIDNLREAVLTDARALGYEIMQEAIRRGDEVAAEATSQIAEDRAQAMSRAEAEAEKQRQRLSAEAQAEVQRERLVAREQMIARVIEEVRERLRAGADSDQGSELLRRFAVEGAAAVSGDVVKLVVRPADRKRADSRFLKDVGAKAGKRVELSDETHAGLGGVVVTSADGRERFDNTLDNRLERRMPDVRAMIWARVSHAG